MTSYINWIIFNCFVLERMIWLLLGDTQDQFLQHIFSFTLFGRKIYTCVWSPLMFVYFPINPKTKYVHFWNPSALLSTQWNSLFVIWPCVLHPWSDPNIHCTPMQSAHKTCFLKSGFYREAILYRIASQQTLSQKVSRGKNAIFDSVTQTFYLSFSAGNENWKS